MSVTISVLSCHASSLEDVRDAVRREYIGVEPTSDISVLVSAMDEDGKWRDIDYKDESRSLWQLEKHLDRLVDMSVGYVNGNASDKVLHDAIIRGLNQWFDGRYENANWWYTKIGVPRRMLKLAYILDSYIPEELKVKIDRSLDAIDSDDFPARPGGDRIQVLSNHAKVMLWRRDNEGVSDILKKIEDEARIAPYEETMYDAGGNFAVRNQYRPSGRGVQPDMSFHHRGDRVNSTLTYGLELPEYFSYWAELLKDTDMAFSPLAIHFIIDYYLDGVCRHLVAGRYAEPSIMNREISRPGAGVFSPELATSLLKISDGYREPELKKAVTDFEKGEITDSFAVYFAESDYFTFSRPGFRTAVRFHSERNANQEAPHNNEGIRNHFRGDGACMLSISGKEYSDIAPLFDFRMIPGATTPLIPYEPLSEWGAVQILDSPISFAGAVSDSIYGAVAFDFVSERSDLKARKGYFFFDDGYVCLGSGINSDSDHEIVTTVEQKWSQSPNFAHNGKWFSHDGNTYHIMEGNPKGEIERRSGTWRNCVLDTEYEDSVAEGDIFSISISHGVAPRNSKYAYAVTPGKDVSGDLSFEIIANESSHQSVASADGSVLYIVFYEPASVDTPLGRFEAEQSCMLMVVDRCKLYVSDPTRHHSKLNIHTPRGLKKIEAGDWNHAGLTKRII